MTYQGKDGVKRASLDHPVHELLAGRWSPYAFADRRVSLEDLRAIFEAARWAPSAFNEQPWRYLVARREDEGEFARLLSCLVEGNQLWARHAPVLALGVVGTRFARNDQPNRAAAHDLGLASAALTVEATSRGLAVHQMAGILPDRSRELYSIPEGFEPFTGLAIGYAGEPGDAPEAVRERDLAPRARRPREESVFAGTWGRAALRQ